MKVSALEGEGVAESWAAMEAFRGALADGGHLKILRELQARRWFWSEVEAVLSDEIAADPATAAAAARLEASVIAGKALPHAAARDLIRGFRRA